MRKILIWSKENKFISVSLLVTLVIFLALLPLAFLNQIEYPLGFLFGSLISYMNYFVLDAQADIVVNKTKKRSAVMISLFSIVRILLYGSALLLASILTYYSRIRILNVFTVFAGFLPAIVLMFIIKEQ